jgi:TonB family protein
LKRVGFIISILLLFSETAINQPFIPAKTITSTQLLKDFIDQTIIYPQNDLVSHNEGDVVFEFKVDASGNTSSYKLMKGISREANNEALHILQKIRWQPALQNGKPVVSTQSYTVNYNVKRYQRLLKKRPAVNILPTSLMQDTTGRIFTLHDLEKTPVPLLDGQVLSLTEIIRKELKYPEAAHSLGIQGTVKLGMIIENDGIASNIYIINSVGGGCDNETIRILQSIRWIPGIVNDQTVRTNAFFEVTFRLNENNQDKIQNQQNTGL